MRKFYIKVICKNFLHLNSYWRDIKKYVLYMNIGHFIDLRIDWVQLIKN